MTPSAAFGKDCLSITLGDGDEEKFMDNVLGCVSAPQAPGLHSLCFVVLCEKS